MTTIRDHGRYRERCMFVRARLGGPTRAVAPFAHPRYVH
jgi:hypothetical protein